MKAACDNAGAVAWLTVASGLVLFMIPGLALFEVGLLPRSTAQSVLFQVLGGALILLLLWVVAGFSFVFGNMDHFLLAGVSTSSCSTFAPEVPDALFMLFQGLFATITPLLATG